MLRLTWITEHIVFFISKVLPHFMFPANFSYFLMIFRKKGINKNTVGLLNYILYVSNYL